MAAAAKKTLVIVESPSKAKTIGKFLGSRYKVVASVGHVRDLPKSKLGIVLPEDLDNIESDPTGKLAGADAFDPQYINIRGKGDVIKELKNQCPDSNIVAIDFDPGASEVNQVNRIKLMLTTAKNKIKERQKEKSAI